MAFFAANCSFVHSDRLWSFPDVFSGLSSFFRFSIEKSFYLLYNVADEGFYKCTDSSELFKLASPKYRLEYLYHYVAYQSLIIEMCASTTIRLELTVDYVEFYWK